MNFFGKTTELINLRIRKIHFIFLSHYAYERQGSARAYRTIAKRVIDTVFLEDSFQISSKKVVQAWELYKQIQGKYYPDLGLNITHQPLKNDKGVLKKLHEKKSNDIYHLTSDLLLKDKVGEAYKFISSIRGVGHKITALYLRDIAYNELSPVKHYRKQYQPIDTWLDQAIDIVTRIKEKTNIKTRDNKRQFIVDLCKEAECSPIDFNAGAWYSGSVVAQDYGVFRELILDKKKALSLIQEKINKNKDTIKAMETWIQDTYK